MIKRISFFKSDSEKKIYALKVLILLAVTFTFVFLNISVGESNLRLSEIFRILMGENLKGSLLVTTFRLPRTIAGILCGFAFGVAGNTFQTLLKNPLASPDIIGVSSGTTVSAVFFILFTSINRGAVSMIAVITGLITAFIIYMLSCNHGFSVNRLILTGIGIQAFFNALISWMVLKASEYDVPTAMRWMMGNLNGITGESLPLLALVTVAGTVAIMILTEDLKAMELGEHYAIILGVKVSRTRLSLITASILLIAFATSVSGPIASVSFLAGPIAARIFGKRSSNIITSGLIGACIVSAADFAGQNLLFTRYPVGVITGLVGTPVLIFLLIKQFNGGKA